MLLGISGELHRHVPGGGHLRLLLLAVRFGFSLRGDCDFVTLAALLVLVVGVELGAHKFHLGAGVPHCVLHGALGVPLVLLALLCLEGVGPAILHSD